MNQVNASTPAVFIATALKTTAVVAALFFSDRLHAESYAAAQFLPAGLSPGYLEPDHLSPPDAKAPAVRAPELAGARPLAVAKPRAAAPGLYSSLKYAFFCFGPVFGNDSREVDPNFMPPPAATDGASRGAAPAATVRYTRVPATSSDKTTWVGTDGSRISYLARSSEGGGRGEAGDASGAAEQPNVANIIAENRKEMTKISWTRAYRRFPELGREGSPERSAFEAYLTEKQSDSSAAAAFESPMWPESVAAAFMSDWNWKKAEEESWERVRAKVRIFNDRESVYTRRFLTFAEGLRMDPEGAAIFKEPTWPEKALELHDQKLGAVPPRFR